MSDKIQEFEGLRAVLALWVLVFHVFAISGIPCFSAFDGAHAVSVFFALSGFVIARSLDARPRTYRCFLIRRFFRLFPAYGLCIFVTLILVYLGVMPKRFDDEVVGFHAVLHALMLHGVVPKALLVGAEGAFLNPAWSVTVEWQFYLAIPLFFMLRRWNPAVAWLFLLFVVAVARRLLVPILGLGGGSLLEHSHIFVLGILSYFLFKWISFNKEKLYLACEIAPLALPLALIPILPITHNLGVLIWLFFLGVSLSFRGRRHWLLVGWITRLLRTPVLGWLGAVSYALYLIHEPIIWIVHHGIRYYVADCSPQRSAMIITFVSLPVSVFLAHWIHHWVELPSINYGKRIAENLSLK
jgi:peptidoglycan/LPS O-acetylase OafA/YrhL